MQQLWSYLWFRFTAVTALGKSTKISLNSDKELLRKSRLCSLIFFLHFSDFYMHSLHFPLWDQRSLYTSCFEKALGHLLSKGVWGGWCYVSALALGSGELPRWESSHQAHLPRAFQILKILNILWEKKWGSTRWWPLCQEAFKVGSQVQEETLGQEGSTGVIRILFFLSKFLVFRCQVPNPPLLPHTLVPHLLLLTEMCL